MKRTSLLPFVVLAAVAAGCATRPPPQPGPAVRFADGTLLQFEGATYGKQHRRQLKAAGWRGFFSKHEGSTTTDRDALVVWFSQPPLPSGGTGSLDYRISACDAHGCRFDSGSWGSSSSGSNGFWGAWRSPILHRWELNRFPRRGKTVLLRFYDRSRLERPRPAADLDVPNPAPGPYPTWKAEPYPITKRAGDLAVTLVRVQGLPQQPPGARAWFRFTRGGRRTRDWEPIRISVADPTGNTAADETGGAWDRTDGEVRFNALCPYEPAWKLRVEVAPRADSRVTPVLRWTVRGIAVPKRDTITRSTAMTSQNGVSLQLLGVAGVGTVRWSENASSDGAHPSVRVLISPKSGLRETLQATDDRGRKVVSYPIMGSSDSPAGRISSLFLEIPPGAKRLNLTFTVHRSRVAEFVARPQPPGAKRQP